MAQLIVISQMASSRSYLGGAVTLTAMGNYSATPSNIFALARDPQLIYDAQNNNVYISDSINVYIGINAVAYLQLIAGAVSGAVVGYVGASIPTYAIAVGAQDQNGNTQIASLYNDQLNTSDLINVAFTSGVISVGTTPVQVMVGGAPLANRKYVRVQPLNGTVYQGSSSSITASSGPIFANQIEVKSMSANVTNWYIVAASGTVNVYIEEGS